MKKGLQKLAKNLIFFFCEFQAAILMVSHIQNVSFLQDVLIDVQYTIRVPGINEFKKETMKKQKYKKGIVETMPRT